MINSNVFDTLPQTPYVNALNQIREGDLLLCSGNSQISLAIKQTTHSVFSHVGVILQLPVTKQFIVLESVESIGVRCVTLAEGYITNYMGNGTGYDGKILIARHSAFAHVGSDLPAIYQRAFSLLGDQYNEKDIFQIAARFALGKLGIDEQGNLTGNNSYICSEYAYACYKAIGITLPLNPLGFIAPSDIANAAEVNAVLQLKVA